MQESLEVLKQKNIISSDDVQSLRLLIAKNHPELTDTERAKLFAKLLHQKLDESLATFDVALQNNIKRALIEQTVTRKHFSITALDILENYINVEDVNSSNIHLLTSWVNQYNPHPLTDEGLLLLTQSLVPLSDDPKAASSETLTLDPLTFEISSSQFSYQKILVWLSSLCLGIILLLSTHSLHPLDSEAKSFSNLAKLEISLPISLDLGRLQNHLQPHLQYKEIDKVALNHWLTQRGSLLATEPYFSTLLNTSETFNINPLLLFAITGQEQNFVPTTHDSALKMANNPFNLYGSWQQYNTSIEDAARIVSRTIIRLGKNCPTNHDQIQWINRQYAADPNWHIGVTYFLNELEGAMP